MENLQEQFAKTVSGPIVVHWDGKFMDDYTGTWAHKKVDRLAVIVSNSSQEQLFNIAKRIRSSNLRCCGIFTEQLASH